MRIVHTADWHIGKLLCEYSLLSDQRTCLFSFADQIASLGADILIIAGDLYDRSVPPAEAVVLLDELFSYLLFEKHIKILAISGNHDSPKRLQFGNRLMQQSGLFLRCSLTDAQVPIVLSTGSEQAAFYLLPYFEPHQFKEAFDDAKDCRTVQACMNYFLTVCKSEMNKNIPNILVAHGFFSASAEDTDLAVGTASLVSLHDHPFSYVALGHLHAPRTAGSERIRYAGSPLKYSIDEANQKKSFTVIDIQNGAISEISQVPILPVRDVRKIHGTLEELCRSENASDDFVFAVLTDPQMRANAMRRLKQTYKNALGLSYECLEKAPSSFTKAANTKQDMSPQTLFASFFQEAVHREMTPSESSYMQSAFDQAQKGGTSVDPRFS